MLLMGFLRKNNWNLEVLERPPYNIIVKTDGDYSLLKYNTFASDMGDRIVQQCRGTIVRRNSDGTLSLVCAPFYKFFNYGEQYAHIIDWETATVMQKVDGSLMNVWYSNGWHLSTSGTVDAFKANCDAANVSFGDLFLSCIKISWFDFCRTLDPRFTYMFEMTTSQNRVVVRYPRDGIWYLGRRNNYTLEEDRVSPQFYCYVNMPQIYSLSSLEDCVEAAKQLGDNAEGFVVCDKYYNRIKVKNPAWLAASKLHNNGNVTAKTVLEMYFNGTLDDYIGTFPEDKQKIEFYLQPLLHYIEELNNAWDYHLTLEAIIKSNSPHRDYLFGRLKGKWFNGNEYVAQCTIPRLVKMLYAN